MGKELISVVVITYNSEAFVVETLESIKNQSYKNIELIISDDFSSDNTVKICAQWLKENSERFSSTSIITTPVNSGIPANCNRGILASSGTWIKLIAGDDILTENCIEDNINYANQKHEIKAIHSESAYYNESFNVDNFLRLKDIANEKFNNSKITAKEQFVLLLQGCYVNTPTVFIKKEVYEEFGYYDESIKTVEDWPMWIKLSENGIKFYYLPTVTVNYRVHNKSVTNAEKVEELFTKQQKTEWEVYKKYILHHLSPTRRKLEILENKRMNLLIDLGFTKRNLPGRIFNYSTFKILKYFRDKAKENETKNI